MDTEYIIFLMGRYMKVYENGEIYKGEFKNDLREGKGVIFKDNKEIYKGEFKNDKPIDFNEKVNS